MSLRFADWKVWLDRIRGWSMKSAYVMGGQVLGLGLGIASTFLLSHWVAKPDYAQYALFISLASVGIISHGGLINFVTRFWSIESSRRPALWHFTVRTFWRHIPLLVSQVFLASLLFVDLEKPTTRWLVGLLAALSTVGFVRLTLNTAAFNAGEQFGHFFLLNASSAVLRFVFPIGFAIAFHGSFLALAAGFAIQAAAVYGICGTWLKPAPPSYGEPTANTWPEQLRSYGRPFVWIGLGTWLMQFADRWIVSFFFDAGRVADFSYASQIVGFLPAMIASWFLQIAYPSFFRHVDEKKENADWHLLCRRADALMAGFLVLSLAGTCAIAWGTQFLVGNLISENYRGCLAVLIPASMAMTALQINQFHYVLLQANMDSSAIMRIILWVSLSKTLLVVLAAAVSWQSLVVIWLASPLAAGLLGRTLVRRTILRFSSAAP